MTKTADAPGPSPSLALLLAAAGGGLVLGARPTRDTPARPLFTLAGLALLGAAVHRPLADALRMAGTKRRAANLQFSFVVDRPVEQVFGFCADFENFPRFIGAIREVHDNGDGRSHWCASTPSGGEIEWNAAVTKFVTNAVIAWKSTPGSPIASEGLIRFRPDGAATCVQVCVTYRVLNSTMADALAALVTPRREHELEADIRRIASHIDDVESARPAALAPLPA